MHLMEFKDFIENSYIHIKDLHHFMLAPSLSSTGEDFSKCTGTTSFLFLLRTMTEFGIIMNVPVQRFIIIQRKQNPMYTQSEGFSTLGNPPNCPVLRVL